MLIGLPYSGLLASTSVRGISSFGGFFETVLMNSEKKCLFMFLLIWYKRNQSPISKPLKYPLMVFSSANGDSFHLITSTLNWGITVKVSNTNWRNPMTAKITNQNHKIKKIYWFIMFWFNWQIPVLGVATPPEPPIIRTQFVCKKCKNVKIFENYQAFFIKNYLSWKSETHLFISIRNWVYSILWKFSI